MNKNRTKKELIFFKELAYKNETEFERFFSISVGAVAKIVYNRQFTVLYFSEGVLDLIDIIPGNEIPLAVDSKKFIHKDDYEYVYQEIGKYSDKKEPFSFKYRLVTLAGKEIWVQIKGIFLDDLYQDKYPIMYIAYTDITSIVKANELLEQEVQRYKIFTNFVHECFFDYMLAGDELKFYNTDIGIKKYYDIWLANKELILKAFYDNNQNIETDMEFELANGTKCWYSLRAKGIYDSHQRLVKIIGTMKDIQQEKEQEFKRIAYEEKLKNKAHYDHMTGLLNRFACEKIVDQVLKDKIKNINGVVIDVDNFKEINDVHGHFIGDQVLIKIGRIFRKYCRTNDIAARLGGDEFFIMFIGQIQQDTIRARLQTMHQEIHKIAQELELEVPVSLSMGVTRVYPGDKSFSDIYVRADETMYQAKLSGKNTLICFNED